MTVLPVGTVFTHASCPAVHPQTHKALPRLQRFEVIDEHGTCRVLRDNDPRPATAELSGPLIVR